MGEPEVEILPPLANSSSSWAEKRHVPGVGHPPKLTAEQVRWALVKTKYNVTRSAMILGVARSSIHNYIERYPELGAELKAEVIAMMCDRARDVVYKAVDVKEDVRTSVHVLATHEAGWQAKQNIEHTGTVQHSLQGAELMSREQIAAMPDAELKKMIAVREAECADARANVARIEAAMAEREAQDGTGATGPATDEAGGSETAI
jgi:predicted transcriptional regulator